MKKVGLREKHTALIKDIGVGKQQLVEIAKALSKKLRTADTRRAHRSAQRRGFQSSAGAFENTQ